MKKFLQLAAAAALAALAVVSCEEKEVLPNTLEVSPSADLEFGAKGNEAVVLTVTTDASSYEVDAEDWVVIEKSGDKLTVNVEDNKEAQERECEMTITAGTAQPVTIGVKQAAGEADAISVEPVSLLFRATGNDPQTVTVTTNVEDWSYEPDYGDGEEGWFTVTPSEDNANVLTVSVSDYSESDGERTGSIDLTAGDAKVSVEVKQSARDMISVEPVELSFGWNETEGKTLTVTTTAPSWDAVASVDGEGESWLSVEKSENTVTVTVQQNDQVDTPRTGKVTFTGGNATPVEITVTQEGKPAPVEVSISDSGMDAERVVKITLEQEQTSFSVNPALNLASAVSGEGTIYVWNMSSSDVWMWNQNHPDLQVTAAISQSNISGEYWNSVTAEFSVPVKDGATSATCPVTVSVDGLEAGNYLFSVQVGLVEGNMVAGENNKVTYIVTVPQPPIEKKYKNLLIMEVNDNNPLNVLELKYVDDTYFYQGLVLFSSNVIFNSESGEVEFSFNDNVRKLLVDGYDTYIRPIKDAGIKVYLSLLPHHTEAALSNLKESTAELLALEVAGIVDQYDLDGVFIDDEYGGYGTPSNYPDVFYPESSYEHYARFAYELDKAMTETCGSKKEVILYQINQDEVFPAVDGVQPNEYLGLVMNNYGSMDPPSGATYGKEQMELSGAQCTASSFSVGSFASTSASMPGKSRVNRWEEEGNEWIAWFNLVLDPTIETFNWTVDRVPLMVRGTAILAIGCDIQMPTGYYHKDEPGDFYPDRITYDYGSPDYWDWEKHAWRWN